MIYLQKVQVGILMGIICDPLIADVFYVVMRVFYVSPSQMVFLHLF